MVVAETLRMYPEPPLLIRRCRTENVLPQGAKSNTKDATVIRGMDMFISLYNIHRSPDFWEEPDAFDPMRFTRRFKGNVEGWNGFDPKLWEGQLYPNENSADFAFLPFGGGARKCVGDQFAMLEATVTLATVLQKFVFEFDHKTSGQGREEYMKHPQGLDHPVGMRTGATIHTRQGLHMLVKKR